MDSSRTRSSRPSDRCVHAYETGEPAPIFLGRYRSAVGNRREMEESAVPRIGPIPVPGRRSSALDRGARELFGQRVQRSGQLDGKVVAEAVEEGPHLRNL